MSLKPLPFPVSELRKKLRYCPDSGKLFWLVSPSPVRNIVGLRAGTLGREGYRSVRIGGLFYREHRIAFYLMTGECPEFIDHINGVRDDNRWANLRPCSASENQCNRAGAKNTASGVKGVKPSKTKGRFEAVVQFRREKHHLGTFLTLEAAASAYAEAVKRLHGEFAWRELKAKGEGG